jgi:hypothetical protein
MAKKVSIDLSITTPWGLRISQANKYYKKWENRFRCDTLENYWEGFQWRLANGVQIELSGSRRPYTVNLVYTTIKRKVANITYTYPEFILTPRPGQMDWNQDFAVRSAQLKEDALNTKVSDPRLEFVDDIRYAALDSFFRFAVMEVGYSKDWQNPNAPKLEMESHEDPLISDTKDRVVKYDELPDNEAVYTKWISARRFRVSMSDNVKLRNCDWCGYYGFISKKVLQETEGIKFPSNYDTKYYSIDTADALDYFKENKIEGISDLEDGELCKVWHIWDNISKKRLLILDGPFVEMYSESFERLPFATYRSDISLKGWYPIPPVWQWLSPQNEVNEAREQIRRYRRRATRKFEVSKGDHDTDELEKLKTDEDGSIIVTKRKDGNPSVRPIQNPQIDANIVDGLTMAKDDFDIVASIPVARGRASDRQTATATRQIASDQSIVESLEQIDFSRFVSAVGREMLLQMGEKLEQGFWIKSSLDPGNPEDIFSEVQDKQPIYNYITSQSLVDGYDFDIICNVVNSTPENMVKEKASFIEFLSLVTQFPAIAMSPTLVRETAYRCGYKNERVIREYQKMAMLALMEKANMAGQSVAAQGLIPQGNQDNGAAAGMAQRQMPNSLNDITAQLYSQVGQ